MSLVYNLLKYQQILQFTFDQISAEHEQMISIFVILIKFCSLPPYILYEKLNKIRMKKCHFLSINLFVKF